MPHAVLHGAAAGDLGRKTISKPGVYAIKYQVVIRQKIFIITIVFLRLERE
jgi:hypothetical protein